jgi:hypothetical protein
VDAYFQEITSLLKKVPLGPKCICRDVFGRYETRDGQLRALGESPTAPVSEAIHAFGVEAVESGAHGLGMAAEFFGYLGGAKSLPTQGDDPGAEVPVTGGTSAAGQFTDLRLFSKDFGHAGVQRFRHSLLLPGRRFSVISLCVPSLRNGALEA